MYYHYHPETKEFIFESIEKIEDYPSTEIDIIFNLGEYRNQIFSNNKWIKIFDYRKARVYKKNSYQRVYKKLGENLSEDEVIINEFENIEVKQTSEEIDEEIKKNLKNEINGFLAKTDKYFNNDPPKYKGDIENLKKHRHYLYELTEQKDWWKKPIRSFEE